MRFELQVLGANSALPMPGRFPSSFVLNHNEQLNLIDCGEGSQIKMSEFRVKRSKIDRIFISHLHGDHIFGLPGVLHSFNLNARTRPLTLYGPPGIGRFVNEVMIATGGELNYPLSIEETRMDTYNHLVSLEHLDVYTFPLKHRVPTVAFKFVEKPGKFNIRKEAIEEFQLTIDEIKTIKEGKGIERKGMMLSHKSLVHPRNEKRTFVYCSDTCFDTSIVAYIRHADLLYHEATYMHEMADKAKSRLHSTAHEAALIAKKSDTKKLLIGHYSSRYKDLEPMLEEAKNVFPNTLIAREGEIIPIG